MVNTLDEALRVLKNEIRKHKPLSVSLTASPEVLVAEMGERGVRPDVVVVDFAPGVSSWAANHGWSEVVLEAASATELRALDGRLLEVFAEDVVRRRWVQRIGQYQRTGNVRVVWLTDEERAALIPA